MCWVGVVLNEPNALASVRTDLKIDVSLTPTITRREREYFPRAAESSSIRRLVDSNLSENCDSSTGAMIYSPDTEVPTLLLDCDVYFT